MTKRFRITKSDGITYWECASCYDLLPEKDFIKIKVKNKVFSYCKKCMKKKSNIYSSAWYKKNGEVYYKKFFSLPENIKKRKAQRSLRDAIGNGEIRRRGSCEICHRSPTHCHHEDYSKPFQFIELCQSCHLFLHKQYKERNIIIK